MNLTLIEASKKNIVSLEEAKNYLRVDHEFDDGLINVLIKATQEALETIIQKSLVKTTWKYEIDTFGESLEGNCIMLPKIPVIKILEVSVGGKKVENCEYKLEKSKLYFKNSVNKFPIVITYEAGIANTVEEVPYQLKLANLMLISTAYNERYAYDQNCTVSKGVKQLLLPFLDLRFG